MRGPRSDRLGTHARNWEAPAQKHSPRKYTASQGTSHRHAKTTTTSKASQVLPEVMYTLGHHAVSSRLLRVISKQRRTNQVRRSFVRNHVQGKHHARTLMPDPPQQSLLTHLASQDLSQVMLQLSNGRMEVDGCSKQQLRGRPSSQVFARNRKSCRASRAAHLGSSATIRLAPMPAEERMHISSSRSVGGQGAPCTMFALLQAADLGRGPVHRAAAAAYGACATSAPISIGTAEAPYVALSNDAFVLQSFLPFPSSPPPANWHGL